MLPKMKASHFVKKYSVQFINQHGKLSEPFYFLDHKPHESSQTWQVKRAELDTMLLENARARGVAAHEGARVLEVLFEGGRAVGVRVQRAAGDGWVAVGDAFGFLDPLYSSGVLLALKSGSMAADAVAEGLAEGDTSAAQLGKWEGEFTRGMDRMRRLVCAYYEGFSFGRFVKQYPQYKGHLTDLLIGDLFKDSVDEVFPLIDGMKREMARTSLRSSFIL